MTDERDEREPLAPEVRAAMTPERVRAATRERLVARAAADARARGVESAANLGSAPAPARPSVELARSRGVSTWVFATAAMALAASLVVAVRLKLDRDSLRETFAVADRAKDQRIDSLRTLVGDRDRFVASLTGPQVRVVGLNTAQTKNPRAMMFWDQATNRWTFIAHNLAPLQAGRTYQLWLVTATKKISAGTFAVNATGDALVQATYALDRDALKAVAVTEEPAGGVPQPTGAMVVVGTAGTQ